MFQRGLWNRQVKVSWKCIYLSLSRGNELSSAEKNYSSSINTTKSYGWVKSMEIYEIFAMQ